jgi:sulfur carrier protein
VATARNGEIVHKGDRADTTLAAGDAIEIVAPMQGG